MSMHSQFFQLGDSEILHHANYLLNKRPVSKNLINVSRAEFFLTSKVFTPNSSQQWI